MYKKWMLLLILLALAFGMAVPTGQVVADGANHVYFTATTAGGCDPNNMLPPCSYGEVTTLPNGKNFITGWVDLEEFTAEDARWTVECVFSGDPFPPGNMPITRPIKGSFFCTPKDPMYAGGWWEGTVSQVAQPSRWISEWHAKGYGIFDGLLAISRNSVHNTLNEIEIIELPGYQPLD